MVISKRIYAIKFNWYFFDSCVDIILDLSSMNKKEKKKILRRFCHNTSYGQSFLTFEEAEKYVKDVQTKWNWDEARHDIVHCTICGEWHLLRNENAPYYSIYPNAEEREIIINEPFVEKDFSKKRTKRKMLGRFRNVQKHPKPKRMFGTVPDNGWFDSIISTRYVCFNCRKSWRSFVHRKEQRYLTYERSQKMNQVCPHCGNSLQRVYPMFRAPKRNDIKKWQLLENKYRKTS
jgi:hypothetical protein